MKTALLALLLTFVLAQDTATLHPIYVPLESPLLTAGNANQNANMPSIAIQSSDGHHCCRADQRWDPSTGTCVAKCIQTMMCIATKAWDPVKCSCECIHQQHDCNSGYHWNYNLCKCEQNHLTTSP